MVQLPKMRCFGSQKLMRNSLKGPTGVDSVDSTRRQAVRLRVNIERMKMTVGSDAVAMMNHQMRNHQTAVKVG